MGPALPGVTPASDPAAVAIVMIAGFAVNALAALVAARRGPRAVLALALTAGAWIEPFLIAPAHPTVRVLAGLACLVATMRVIDLVHDTRDRSAALRVATLFSVYDARRLRRAPPRFDARLAAVGCAYAVAGVAGFLGVIYLAPWLAPRVPAWTYYLARWAAGGLAAYATLDAGDASLRLWYQLAGYVATPLQDRPIASRSLGEFWGRRWNNEVSSWLAAHCFKPLARRRLGHLGLAASFAASAFLHGGPWFAATGWRLGACMAGFFLVQGAFALLERPLAVPRWRPALAHTWTLTILVASSPLFVEPALASFEL